MNIFVLDPCPVKAAQSLNDKHVVKMCLESAQILCTVHHDFGLDAPYRPTHKRHPCTLWVSASHGNYIWLRRHAIAIGEEYTRRYGKAHKSHMVVESLPTLLSSEFPAARMTPFALAMPDEYKAAGAEQSYRNYYKAEKDYGWNKGRQRPDWMSGE